MRDSINFFPLEPLERVADTVGDIIILQGLSYAYPIDLFPQASTQSSICISPSMVCILAWWSCHEFEGEEAKTYLKECQKIIFLAQILLGGKPKDHWLNWVNGTDTRERAAAAQARWYSWRMLCVFVIMHSQMHNESNNLN